MNNQRIMVHPKSQILQLAQRLYNLDKLSGGQCVRRAAGQLGYVLTKAEYLALVATLR